MKKVVLGLIVGSMALSAHAQGDIAAEFMFGTAEQTSSIDGVGSTSGDDLSFGLRGAYTLNPNFGFEFSYQNYGETDDTYVDEYGDTINDKVTTTAFNAGIKGIIPFENGLALVGRFGMANWDIELEETDSFFPGEVFTADDSGTDFYYGIGAQAKLKESFTIGLEYTITEMDLSFVGISADHEVENLALSFGYLF